MILPRSTSNAFRENVQEMHQVEGVNDRNIRAPGPNDVIFGRGGGSIHNDSNVRYRKLVKAHQRQYVSYETRHMKTLLTHELVKRWKQQSPSGRFIKKDEKTGLWYNVSTNDARRKTAQLLREGAKAVRTELMKNNEEVQHEEKKFTPYEEIAPMASAKGINIVGPDIATRSQCQLALSETPDDSNNNSNLLSDLKEIVKREESETKAAEETRAFPYTDKKTSLELLEDFFEDILDDSLVTPNFEEV